MNRWFQARLLIFCAAGLAIFSACGQSLPDTSPKNFAPAPMPPYPPGYSPVTLFRQLLAMSPDERENYLTNRPPEIRQRLLKKVQEYLALDPDERELRLRATELRWFLLPLLRESPTNYNTRLAEIPPDLRELVESRLTQWEILPPELQQEFLDNEPTLRYFARVDVTNNSSDRDEQLAPGGDELARWNSLTENQRRAITNEFNQFFELTPDEKQETLNTLSDAERAQMEKTLQSFSALPPGQRSECIHAFAKFASMNPEDRAEFLKNADRWAQMSPKERQAWRDLVTDVPQWPPLPTAFIMPPPLPPKPQMVAATNLN